MAVSKKAIEKAVQNIERRIVIKKNFFNDYKKRFEKGEVSLKDFKEYEEIVKEDLSNLDQLLVRAKAGERMKLNYIWVEAK